MFGKTLERAYQVDHLNLSPAAIAYARARGADRESSYGDWVAVSTAVDLSLAMLLKREVSDGIIAPSYEPEALAILSKKKRGEYIVVEIDKNYVAPQKETREVFGIELEQRRNQHSFGRDAFRSIVTSNKDWPETAWRDAVVALAAVKYAQSNSVSLAIDGQAIAVAAGQQSRVACTRIACAKAESWYLRQHPSCLNLEFRSGISRHDRDNAITSYIRADQTAQAAKELNSVLASPAAVLSQIQKEEWIAQLRDVVLASDGCIPFRDSIDRAHLSGVRYVAQPGGSSHDKAVTDACDECGMTMVHTGVRLFHH